jgi:hypothetical protein
MLPHRAPTILDGGCVRRHLREPLRHRHTRPGGGMPDALLQLRSHGNRESSDGHNLRIANS